MRTFPVTPKGFEKLCKTLPEETLDTEPMTFIASVNTDLMLFFATINDQQQRRDRMEETFARLTKPLEDFGMTHGKGLAKVVHLGGGSVVISGNTQFLKWMFQNFELFIGYGSIIPNEAAFSTSG